MKFTRVRVVIIVVNATHYYVACAFVAYSMQIMYKYNTCKQPNISGLKSIVESS